MRTHGQDLALLGRLWAAALEWDELYAGWKDCAFAALDVGVMQSAAARIGCTLQNLAQDIQTWPAFEWIQAWPMRLRLLMCRACTSPCLVQGLHSARAGPGGKLCADHASDRQHAQSGTATKALARA